MKTYYVVFFSDGTETEELTLEGAIGEWLNASINGESPVLERFDDRASAHYADEPPDWDFWNFQEPDYNYD